MKNVKQKFSSCRRAAMLTVTAILLSCLPIGKALAWSIGETVTNTIKNREDASQIYMQVMLTKVSDDGTELKGKLITMRVYFKPSYTGTEFVYPTSMPDPKDPSKTIYITGIDFNTCELINANLIQATKTVTFPEGITDVVSKNLPEFPQAETLKLSSTINFVDNLSSSYNGSGKVLETVGRLNSIVFPNGHSTYRTDSEGRLYSGNQLLYIHSNIFKSTETTLTIPEGVESIADHSIGAYSQIETINLPSTYNAAEENYLGGYNTLCTNLKNIFVASGNNDYYDIDGVLCRYGTKDGQPYNYLYCYPQARTAISYSVPTDDDLDEEGKGISEIIGYAFHENNSISSIDLGDVNKLQSYALNDCNGTGIELTIPAQLTDIEPNAFNLTRINKYIVADGNPVYSSDNDGVLYETDSDNKKVLKEFPMGLTVQGGYTIPSDVDIIGPGAFNGCTITGGNVIISSNVSTIGENAFASSNIQGITFAEGSQVTAIPNNCFEASKITSINLPSTITSIGNAAFKDSQITSIVIPASVTSFGTDVFRKCTQLTSAAFQNSMSTLSDFSFVGCTSLTTVTLPSNCTSIGEEAFNNCSELYDVALPQGLRTIGKYAFRNTKMKDVEFPSTLTTIGYAAFMNCSGWTTLTIPASVSSLGGYAFCNTGVQKVIIENGSQLSSFEVCAFGSTEAPDSWTTAANNTLKEIKFEGSSRITSIGAYAFNKYQALESFTCPPNVTSIGRSAFEDCTSLKNFVFPPALRYIIMSAFYNTALETIDLSKCINFDYIGNTAFAHCAVSEIIFPDAKIRLDFEAFRDCPNLTEVTLPKYVQEVDGSSFCFCPNLMNYYVEESSNLQNVTDEFHKYSAVGGYLLTSDKEKLVAFPEARTDKNFTLLPPSITDIGDYAFYGCESLENVTIPNKVTNISGIRAFGLCKKLNTITFLCDQMINPSAIEQRSGKQAFDNNSLAGKTIYVRKELLEDYEKNSFYSTAAAIIPSFEEDVRDFDTDLETAKKGVEKNEYINVSENVVSMISTKSKDHTFVLSPSVKHVYNEDEDAKTLSVELIGDYAFQNAAADIEEVVVMDYIKYIGANAFITSLAADASSENTSTIERIFFVNTKPDTEYKTEDKLTSMISTTRFKLKKEDLVGGKDYSEFLPVQRIFVKKSMLADYNKYWPEYEGQIDYKISPLATTRAVDPTETKYDFIKIEASKKYATFSREFDVDLGEYAREKDESFDIKAFTTGVLRGGSGRPQDYPEENNDHNAPYHLKMYHIGYDSDAADAKEYDKGTYVPNNTGVLLAVMNGWGGTPGGPDGYFYCIGEKDNGGARNADNTGNGTLRKSVEAGLYKLPAITAVGGKYHPTQWVMQGGVFRPVKGTDVYLPAHKAWLYLDMDELASDASASASAIAFSFSLDGLSEDTGVDAPELTTATTADGIYTLTGVKVLKPEGKGIYIVNGKKMVIK